MTMLAEPTRQSEAWRYIETSFLAEHPKGISKETSLPTLPDSRQGCEGRLVFANGQLSESDPLSSYELGEETDPELFNPARKDDWYASRHVGVRTQTLNLAKGASEKTLEIVVANQGAGVENINSLLIRAPKASEHTLVLRTVGNDGNHLANLEWGLQLEDGARVKVLFDQEDGSEAIVLSSMRASLGRDASLEVQCLSGGSRLVRHRLSVDLNGENSEVFLSGAGLSDGEESLHHFVEINHKVPNARSRQLFKVAMQGDSRSSFDGTIEVDKGADGTDANQLCRYLMLNDKVRASAKPQLKIYADDVACAHGATIGQLEEEEKFYLVSRGLDTTTSSALLVRGFVTEVLEEGSFLSYTQGWQERILNSRLSI